MMLLNVTHKYLMTDNPLFFLSKIDKTYKKKNFHVPSNYFKSSQKMLFYYVRKHLKKQ